ncbi:MAG: hypothetical protein Q9174_004645 [Haloplaca sp. 1 TL-2023]
MGAEKTSRRAGKKTQRPAKRNLVRWDEDKDKTLLLTMQYVMNQRSVRIPWDHVAREMGPKYSEGAIVQHLSKLREKCAKAGIPVPPGLRKGGRNLQGPSNINGTQADPKSTGKSGKRTRKAAKVSDDTDDSDGQQDVDQASSDGEYGQGKAKENAVKTAKGGGKSRGGREVTASKVKKHAGEDSNLSEEEESAQSSIASSEQCFAAGDRMWDLDGGEDTRSEPTSSHPERRILKLKIGVTGFAKLGLGKRSKKAAKGDGESSESFKHKSEESQGDVAVPDYDGSQDENDNEDEWEIPNNASHLGYQSQSAASDEINYYDRVNAYLTGTQANHGAAFESRAAALDEHRNLVARGLSNGFNQQGYAPSTPHHNGGHNGSTGMNSGYGSYLSSGSNSGNAASPGHPSMGYTNRVNGSGTPSRPILSTQQLLSNAGFNA